jgi:hypothetical protein
MCTVQITKTIIKKSYFDFRGKKYELGATEVERKSPVAKYMSGTANVSELLCGTLYLSFGCWGQFLEQNLKVSFRHPDEVTES